MSRINEYGDLPDKLKDTQNKLESTRAALEKMKMMVIEAETVNMELEQIFDQSSTGIWVIDTHFEILRMNQTLARLAARNKDSVRGLKCYDVFPISLCHTPECPLGKIKKGRYELEYDIEKDAETGSGASYLLTANPFFGITGEIMGLVSEFKDITPRRRAETALRKANKELQHLSLMDGLTQVANRRRFDEVLVQEWKRAGRSRTPLSLIFCDIDRFKSFNDAYGHQAGDDCLRLVAQVLRSNLNRKEDFVARYGGEEFTLVLPNTDADGAFHLAEAIRRKVEERRIAHAFSGTSPHVTISLGVSTIVPHRDMDPESLVRIADRALYEAKEGGRNRTIPKPANPD